MCAQCGLIQASNMAGTPQDVDNIWGDDDQDEPCSKAEVSLLNKALRDKLVDSTLKVYVDNSDPNSPLFSITDFKDLHLRQDLLQGVYAMGFNRPSKIQESALPLLLADPPHNMIAQSQSGTGKTAAFVLTMITRLRIEVKKPQALVLAPTLELALQIGDVCKLMGKFIPGLEVAYAVRRGARVTNDVVEEQIVIGTPGTVIDWIRRGRITPADLSLFVLDEADVMISMQGHQDQSIRIQKQMSSSCQTLLFSATYDDDVISFAKKIVKDPIMLTLAREEQTLASIRQVFVCVRSEEEKFEYLSNVYGIICIGQTIVFCKSRIAASTLARRMQEDGHAVAVLTGEMDVMQRTAVLERFRHGKERLLITTNVCSRGIDIDQVSVVVNYDIPYDVVRKQPDYETYLHRIGRTGRFGKTGLAVNFVDGERSRSNLMAIEEHFGHKIEELMPGQTLEKESQQDDF